MPSILGFHADHRRVASSLEEAIAAIQVSFDPDSLAAAVMYDPPGPPGATIYREVKEHVEVTDLVYAAPVVRPRDLSEAAARLRQSLEVLVAAAIGDAKNVAVFTGGGVDSAALMALAHRHGRAIGARVFAVALDYEADGDDRPHLAALERHLGCEVHRVTPEAGADFFSYFERGVDAAPLFWPSGCLDAALHHCAKREGAEVALSGVGGDELFDGNPRRLGRSFLRRPYRTLRAARLLGGFAEPRRRWYDWVVRPALLSLVPRRLRALRSVALDVPSWAGPRLRTHIRRIEHERRRRHLGLASTDTGPWEAEHHHLVATLFHQYDHAAGLVSCRPFLERSVRRLVDSFDPMWLLADHVRRGLFRRVIRDLLPQSIVERPNKAEFASACRRFIHAVGGGERFRRLASMKQLGAFDIVDPRRFAAAFERFVDRLDVTAEDSYVWSALAVESFLSHRSAANR